MQFKIIHLRIVLKSTFKTYTIAHNPIPVKMSCHLLPKVIRKQGQGTDEFAYALIEAALLPGSLIAIY